MAFPVYATASEALSNARSAAARLKVEAAQARDQMLAGDVTGDLIINVVRPALVSAKATFTTTSSTPGIGAEAIRQYSAVVDLDIIAEFTAMVAAVDAAIAWLVTNYPTDVSGRLALVTWDGTDGNLTDVTFTPAQTAALAALLDTVDASITTVAA